MKGIGVGSIVVKQGGDYTFRGTVVAVFTKLSGAVRYVVEDERGLLLIHGPATIALYEVQS